MADLSAIIVAAGSSRRMGFDKLSALIAGREVLGHSVAAFAALPEVAEIVVVGHPDRLELLGRMAAAAALEKNVRLIAGGLRRQDSVGAGLAAVTAPFVAVHDAARPLITPALIGRLLERCREKRAVAPAAPVTDTLKRAGANYEVMGSLDRNAVYAMQTPQVFATDLLRRAYRAVEEKALEITDEVSAVEHLGEAVWLLPHDEPNPKITYPTDLPLAEFWLERRR